MTVLIVLIVAGVVSLIGLWVVVLREEPALDEANRVLYDPSFYNHEEDSEAFAVVPLPEIPITHPYFGIQTVDACLYWGHHEYGKGMTQCLRPKAAHSVINVQTGRLS